MDQRALHGEVRRGLLGVQIQVLTPDIADALGTKASSGAVVAKVERGTAADEAGIKAGEVTTAVNGEAMSNASDLRNRIGLSRVGQSVELEVRRETNKLSFRPY